jgi:hypothetical protein
MSTKQDPGEFDCYAKLAPDEPYFVLRAKDPLAPALIELWAEQRRVQYGVYPKLDEAVACAEQMRAWKRQHPEARPTVPLTRPEQHMLRLKDRLATIINAMRANPEHRVRSYAQELENLL